MRLQRLRLTRFRQFVDQELRLDPNITVIVGRNDTGKTGLLWRFFSQPFYEAVLHSADRPLIHEAYLQPIEFKMTWEVEAADEPRMRAAFGRMGKRIDLLFRDQEGAAKRWRYAVDGEDIEVYNGVDANGQPILREELAPRRVFPAPQYLSITKSVMSMFEARILQPPAEPAAPARALAATNEGSLLRLAGIGGETRPIPGQWTEWPPSPIPRRELTLEEVERRLAAVSARLTERLRAWWTDPPGTTFELRLAGGNDGKRRSHETNSYTLVWSVTDSAGLPLNGAGLLWFVTLLINLELLGEHPAPLLLLFDEPAAPLHPSAQRMVARLLDSLSNRWQILCSTHSPFLIDWNFPQRVRMFVRDPERRHTIIVNRPYAGGRQIWDPLRESIGVTVGDVTAIGDRNVLVEGISDQIILANASRALEAAGEPYLDLTTTSILPCGEDPVLREMLARVRIAHARAVALVDRDDAGQRKAGIAKSFEVAALWASGPDRLDGDSSIEDVVGVSEYLRAVNEAHSEIEGIPAVTEDEIRAARGTKSLGAYLAERFGKSFSKVGPSVLLADRFREVPEAISPALRELIRRLAEELGR